MDYAMFKIRLGQVLRRRRKDREMTQVQLAALMEIDQANITRLERGLQGFDSETIFRIAQNLNCTLTEIFYDVEQVRAPQLARTTAIEHDESLQEIVDSWRTLNEKGRGLMLSNLKFTKEHFGSAEKGHPQSRRGSDLATMEVSNAERAVAAAGVPKSSQRGNAGRRVQAHAKHRRRGGR